MTLVGGLPMSIRARWQRFPTLGFMPLVELALDKPLEIVYNDRVIVFRCRPGSVRRRRSCMAPTVKDVARLADVSTATVSRVLTGSSRVSPQLSKRVLEAVEALQYKPSRVARSLRTRTTRILGVIVSDIRNPFFTSLVRGIEDVAHANEYSLILCNSDEDPAKEELYISVLMAEAVAGAIVVPIREDSVACATLVESGIPIVAVDRRLSSLNVDRVLVDNVLGAHLAVCHLIEQGCTRIGLIGGPLHTTTGRERLAGYKKALVEHAIELDEDLIKTGDYKQSSGYHLACELLELDDVPTAIFAANNMMTLGALEAIHDRGLHIPRDLALVGFGDMPWAEVLDPALTVVAQPTHELGRSAANVLLSRIANRDQETVEIRLEPTLIIRESCGCGYSAALQPALLDMADTEARQ